MICGTQCVEKKMLQSFNTGMMRRYCHIAVWTILALFATACFLSPARVASPLEFRFALTGNTFPESPFRGKNEALDGLIKRINDDNPLFVIHVGDIVHGGKSWMGISAIDLERQFRDFKTQFALLRPLLFTVRGEKDMLDTSCEHYTRYTGRSPYYSFNYGPAHCIVLDTCEEGKAEIRSSQRAWLEKDLVRHRRAQAIIVFAHYPIFENNAPGFDSAGGMIAMKQADELHDLFKKFPVKAVFSGHCNSLYRTVKDGIHYIVAGCDFSAIRATPHQKVKSAAQYYIVDYRNGDINVIPRSLE